MIQKQKLDERCVYIIQFNSNAHIHSEMAISLTCVQYSTQTAILKLLLTMSRTARLETHRSHLRAV